MRSSAACARADSGGFPSECTNCIRRACRCDATATVPDAVERRYALRLVEQRLHQVLFRDVASMVTGWRSAAYQTIIYLTAHSMAGSHDLLVSWHSAVEIQHVAFDNLIGLDPGGPVHGQEALPAASRARTSAVRGKCKAVPSRNWRLDAAMSCCSAGTNCQYQNKPLSGNR
jgi:hypothetical protein